MQVVKKCDQEAMFSMHGKILLINSLSVLYHAVWLWKISIYHFTYINFFRQREIEGLQERCFQDIFRIYPYSHSRDAPAACTELAFSDLSGYKSFEN